MADMKKPEKGKKPEKITTDAPPGGYDTPGEKAKRKDKIIKRSANRKGKLSN